MQELPVTQITSKLDTVSKITGKQSKDLLFITLEHLTKNSGIPGIKKAIKKLSQAIDQGSLQEKEKIKRMNSHQAAALKCFAGTL